MTNRKEILEYAEVCGNQAAANLLLLFGPDGYEGDYDSYEELYNMLNNEL